MARLDFRLPDIGEGITEAEIVEWNAAVGDAVAEGQVVVAVMTDKATVEMEAPAAGTLVEQGGEAGAMLPIGATLFVLETEDDGAAVEPEPAQARPVREEAPPAAEAAPVEQVEGKPGRAAGGPVLASPAVRQRARDLGIDLATVPTSGEQVRHADLDRYLMARQPATRPEEPAREPGTEIPLTGLRRQIARRMQEAKQHIPHFTYVDELDVTELEALRERLNQGRDPSLPRLSVLPFFVRALCLAVRDFPTLNAHYDDEREVLTRFDAVHVGVATQTDNGLMVPVLRDAQRMDARQIASGIADLAERARSGAIGREELRGSTITVTSLGRLGGIAATPIVNRPEVAILAPHRIVERPVWSGEACVPRRMMNLSISCDHRIVDGYVAAAFVQALKRLFEEPDLLAIP